MNSTMLSAAKRTRLSVDNNNDTPRHSDSPFHMIQVMEKRFDKQTESIKSMLQQMLEESEARLLVELDKRMADMKNEISTLKERVSHLETVANEIEVVKTEIRDIRIENLRNENAFVASDLRINGIPFTEGENLNHMFNGICEKINLTTLPVSSIFRLQNKNNKNRNNSPDAVIIVKLLSPYDKNFFLKSLSIYKKVNKIKCLPLSVAGFNSNNPIYINENLSNANYQIFQAAIRLKKSKHIISAYTFRGLVYVKTNNFCEPQCIDRMEALDFFRSRENLHGANSTVSNINDNYA